MPTVPTLQQTGQRIGDVAAAPAPTARANFAGGTHTPVKVNDTFNIEQQARLAQNGMALGGTLNNILIDQQNQVNQTRISDATNQAVQAQQRLKFDKDVGYINLQGKSALERPDGKSLSDEYGDQFQQSIETISAGLGNEAQRRMFKEVSDQMMTQFRGGVQQHVAREYSSYELSVQDGTVKTAQQQMSLAWGDVAAVEQSKGAIKAAVYETGRLRGWSGQQVQAAMVEQLSVGHSSVMAAAIDAGQLDYAREYLKQNTTELTPEARLQITKTLDVGQFEAKTQTAAEQLYAAANGDPAAALSAARAQYSGKEEDAIVQRIKGYDAEKVALRERAQATAADSAWQVYANTGSLSRISPSTWAAMDGKAAHSLRATARADAEARNQNREVKTDPNIYYALSAMSTEEPDRFKNTDLRGFFDKLSPGDRKHFIDNQTAIKKPERAAEVVTVGAQKQTMVQTLGLKKEQAGLFMQEADKALYAAQQDKGKPLNQDERQKVLDKLALKGEVISGNWYTNDPNMRLYEARAAGTAERFAPEFSTADRTKAKAALQRKGIQNPSNEQINATLKAAYGLP
jgi:hypothetical protein